MNVNLQELLKQEPQFKKYTMELLEKLLQSKDYEDVLKLSYTLYNSGISTDNALNMMAMMIRMQKNEE